MECYPIIKSSLSALHHCIASKFFEHFLQIAGAKFLHEFKLSRLGHERYHPGHDRVVARESPAIDKALAESCSPGQGICRQPDLALTGRARFFPIPPVAPEKDTDVTRYQCYKIVALRFEAKTKEIAVERD